MLFFCTVHCLVQYIYYLSLSLMLRSTPSIRDIAPGRVIAPYIS